MARLGSGSASRSIEGPLVVWGNHPEIDGSSDLFGVKFPKKVHSIFNNYQDVILLAKTFLTQYCTEFNAKVKGFSDSAVGAMLAHPWPGNIRELQNKLKSAVIMAEGTVIQPDDLGLMPVDAQNEPETLNLREVREIAESRAIRKAYQKAEKNMSKTAELLGVTRPTLYSLIDKYHMEDIKSVVIVTV